MKFKLFVLILLVSKISYSQSEKLDEHKLKFIKNVITFFKKSNIDSISSIISFPLRREYPIPSVKNEKEFKQRFNEIFDRTIIDDIANSKTEEWSEVGWRGIMLGGGVVWIDSYKGKIIALNYQSDFEEKQRKDLIDKEKEKLHISLKSFESPRYRIKTKNYLIRIDILTDYNYRYAAWKIDDNESSKPDIIITNGVIEYQGSGGNHIITFSSGNYRYKIYRNELGPDDSSDITLEVEKNGTIILTEDGTLITE